MILERNCKQILMEVRHMKHTSPLLTYYHSSPSTQDLLIAKSLVSIDTYGDILIICISTQCVLLYLVGF